MAPEDGKLSMPMDQVTHAFDRLARRDPLFAAEGADIAACREALVKIEYAAAKLEEAFVGQSVFSWRSWLYRLFFIFFPLHRYALPLSFLRTVLVSEEKRRAYIAEPSFVRGEELADAWLDSARAYGESLARYIQVHKAMLLLEPGARTYSVQDLSGNISTVSHIEQSLACMVRNAQLLKETAAMRKQMLVRDDVVSALAPDVSARVITSGALNPEHARLHALEIAGNITPFRQSDIEEAHGPFFHTVSIFDGMPTQHAFMLYLLHNRETGLRSMWVAVADRYYFTKVWDPGAVPGGGQAPFFSGGLTTADTPYWYEAAGYLYVTRDPSYWMDIATHADTIRRPQLDMQLVRMQKSSLLERMLGACVDDLRPYVRHTQRRARLGGLKSYSLMYALLMRTHPALYYLTFNRSVWRLAESAKFAGERWEPGPVSLYEKESDVLASLSDAELVKVMGAQKLRAERDRSKEWVDV